MTIFPLSVYPVINNFKLRNNMKTLRDYINTIDRLQEGSVGTAIGAGLGAVAGSALGPIGTVGGAALGSQLGDMAGDALGSIFDFSSKGHTSTPVQQDSGGTGYVAAGPDGHTMMSVRPPPGGFGNSHRRTNANGDEIDIYGNTYKDYISQPEVHSITAKVSLPKGGKYADEIQKMEDSRGTREKVIESWDFKGGTLVLLCGDRTRGSENSVGTYNDLTTLATMGDELFAPFFEKMGYKLVSNAYFHASNELGNLIGEKQELKKGMFSDIVHAGACQLFAFESPKGKSLHIVEAQFLGPASVWKNGGEEQLKKLVSSMEPAANIKPLTSAASKH